MSRVIFCPPISRSSGAFGFVVLTGLVAMGCLGLDSHKRQPDHTTDTEPQTCAGVSCWAPEPNTCVDSGELKVNAPSGYCSGGDCFYATRQEECHAGLCDEGVCVSTPCQGVTCIDPPLAFCTAADRTIYAPSGYCTGGDCKYASRTRPCEEACAAGACVDSPCAEVFCVKPPAPYCENGSNLIVFAPEGRCAVVGGIAECRYNSQTLACDHGCQGGRCQDDPCAGVRCDTPPARHCEGAVLVLYEPYGVCGEGGFCSYAEQRHPCIDPCVDALCGEDDACTWVICNAPPASYCKDDAELRVYGRDGWKCEEGFCSYTSSDIPCPGGCADGRCVGAPCVGVSCDKPLAPHCNGNVLVGYEQTGTCTDDGACSYPETNTSCADGCENGKCQTGGDTDTVSDTVSDTGTVSDSGTGTDTETTTVDIGAEWTMIPAGSFWMGTPDGSCPADYPGGAACASELGRDGNEDLHYEMVSWDEALAFANALSAQAGYAACYDCTGTLPSVTCSLKAAYAKPQGCPGYRLPTESEWEYAAR
ncbi:MAG: SUMF1/EgtB/PvdO family nonheme iron enzyme, partial [Myxococcota bacterium]|nr:SUMF1/EgtB/PvdO family nonheme iron enzyme [Myxococcota bacterium]